MLGELELGPQGQLGRRLEAKNQLLCTRNQNSHPELSKDAQEAPGTEAKPQGEWSPAAARPGPEGQPLSPQAGGAPSLLGRKVQKWGRKFQKSWGHSKNCQAEGPSHPPGRVSVPTPSQGSLQSRQDTQIQLQEQLTRTEVPFSSYPQTSKQLLVLQGSEELPPGDTITTPRRTCEEAPPCLAPREPAGRNGLTHPRQSPGPRAGGLGRAALQPVGFCHPPAVTTPPPPSGAAPPGLGQQLQARRSAGWPLADPWSLGLHSGQPLPGQVQASEPRSLLSAVSQP